MCPRVDVEALDKRSSLHQLQELFQRTRYSRIPVFDGEIDKIIGVAMSKDLLEYVFSRDQSNVLDLPVETVGTSFSIPPFLPPSLRSWEIDQNIIGVAMSKDLLEYESSKDQSNVLDLPVETVGTSFSIPPFLPPSLRSWEIDKNIIGVAMSKDVLEYVFSKDQSNVLDLPVETVCSSSSFPPSLPPLSSLPPFLFPFDFGL